MLSAPGTSLGVVGIARPHARHMCRMLSCQSAEEIQRPLSVVLLRGHVPNLTPQSHLFAIRKDRFRAVLELHDYCNIISDKNDYKISGRFF
jgi:hypothetical protein